VGVSSQAKSVKTEADEALLQSALASRSFGPQNLANRTMQHCFDVRVAEDWLSLYCDRSFTELGTLLSRIWGQQTACMSIDTIQ